MNAARKLKEPSQPPVAHSKPSEETAVHTRLLKCALEIEDARAYWAHAKPGATVLPRQAFEEYWFGAKSLPRVEVLLSNMRARFSAFPGALSVLSAWADITPETRKLICHWHLQLADPLYRSFTGEFLVARRGRARTEVTRDLVIGWVGEQGPERWTMPTRIQFASKLLSCAFAAGLVGTRRDPRPLVVPRVSDTAIEYLMYLLRGVTFEGSLLNNPYAASVGLDPTFIEERLRALPSLRFERQGDLLNYGWQYANLFDWAQSCLGLLELTPASEGASA